MSYSQYERGKFIRERMGYLQLIALGKGQMNAEECDNLDTLVKEEMKTAGNTHNSELAKHPIYLEALKAWKKVRERRIKKYESKAL